MLKELSYQKCHRRVLYRAKPLPESHMAKQTYPRFLIGMSSLLCENNGNK
jgi:hypothetical protein